MTNEIIPNLLHYYFSEAIIISKIIDLIWLYIPKITKLTPYYGEKHVKAIQTNFYDSKPRSFDSLLTSKLNKTPIYW